MELTKEQIENARKCQRELLKEDMCDNYCKYTTEIADDDELCDICHKCPLNDL